ncbi:MAG: IPT/TIG domain-containing protein [Deltaproteobacteria bacterium]
MLFRHTISAILLAVTLTVAAYGATAKPLPAQADQNRAENITPITVLSIIPAQGEPGGNVTLYGGGFTSETTGFLGNFEVAARIVGAKQLSFEIPNLAPGLYALFLKREDNSTSKIYNFTVLPQKPIVTALQPDRVDLCSSGRERDVVITGRHFKENSMVFFDGAVIKSRFITSEAISLTVPDIAGGLHQVQVKNSEEASSMAMALLIDAKPEILSITQGDEFVNYYNLIISGKNFLQNSVLIVDGKRLSGLATNSNEQEKLVYVDCSILIYQRHPYDTAPKNFRVQVINSSGAESSVIQVTAP